MKESSREWLEAAKAFAENKNAKILCPECKKGYLFIKDEKFDKSSKVDRYIICNNCKRWNVLTFNTQ